MSNHVRQEGGVCLLLAPQSCDGGASGLGVVISVCILGVPMYLHGWDMLFSRGSGALARCGVAEGPHALVPMVYERCETGQS